MTRCPECLTELPRPQQYPRLRACDLRWHVHDDGSRSAILMETDEPRARLVLWVDHRVGTPVVYTETPRHDATGQLSWQRHFGHEPTLDAMLVPEGLSTYLDELRRADVPV